MYRACTGLDFNFSLCSSTPAVGVALELLARPASCRDTFRFSLICIISGIFNQTNLWKKAGSFNILYSANEADGKLELQRILLVRVLILKTLQWC